VAGSRRIDEADMAFLDRLEALRVYKTKRLERDTLAFSTVTTHANGGATVSNVVTWTVYDGGGLALDTMTFAEKVGDPRTIRLVNKHRKRAKGAAITLIVLTSVGFGVGIPMAADMEGRGSIIGGAMFVLMGSLCASAIPFAAYMSTQAGRYIAKYYTPDEADELIREYNDELGEELGLDRQDVMQMDLQSRRPPVMVLPVLSFGYAGVVGVF
jgi:hypothetical protein